MVTSLNITNGNKYTINESNQIKHIHKGLNIMKSISLLKERRIQATRRYQELIEKIKNMEQVREYEFDNIIGIINTIDTELLRGFELYDKANITSINRTHDINTEIDKLLSEINDLESKQMRYHSNKDDIKIIVKHKKRIINLREELNNIQLTSFIYDSINEGEQPIHIPSLPEDTGNTEITDTTEDTDDNRNKKKTTKTRATNKKTRKVSPKQRSPINIDVKERAKNTLKEVFSFKNKQECLSRSKALFMSKDQILETIERHEELKNLLPDKYKNLTKEQLCTYLFE